MSAVTVAAFDFDETLTDRDTVAPFLRRFTTTGRFARSLLPHTLRLLPMAVRRDRDRLRALATELVFTGRAATEVERAAAAWGATIAASYLRVDTVDRLRWHLQEGHLVAIVSASYHHYVRVVADVVADSVIGDADAITVLATQLEVADGLCTGRLVGSNCRGPEKVRRLETWLRELGHSRADATVYGYGDSRGDREMLAWSDHPHWVDQPLASVAP